MGKLPSTSRHNYSELMVDTLVKGLVTQFLKGNIFVSSRCFKSNLFSQLYRFFASFSVLTYWIESERVVVYIFKPSCIYKDHIMLTVQKFISGKSLFQMNQKPACFTSPIVTHTKRITFESKTARNKCTTFQLRTYVHTLPELGV